MRRSQRSAFFLMAAFGVFAAPVVRGQDVEPRRRIAVVGAGVGADVTRGALDRYWRTGPVASGYVGVHEGPWEVLGTGTLFLHEARAARQSDFAAFAAGLGAGPSLRLRGGVRFTAAAGAGVYTMFFREAVSLTGSIESELYFSGRASVRVPVGKGWSAEAALLGVHVWTREPIREGMLSLGVQYSFGAPGWLTGLF